TPPMSKMPVRRTRLAPSPTGALHLGNARTFALTWALARNQGWEIMLRMEDLDGPRVRDGAVEATLDVLRWLGLDWDGHVRQQSQDLAPYRSALERLGNAVFRCERSRKDVRSAASAPHRDDGESRFPPSLRPEQRALQGWTDGADHVNYRLLVDPANVPVHDELHDELCGAQGFDPGAEVGDFLVWTKLGVPSYQLAVVVDDLAQGITDVVRGDDLLPSAARQLLLRRLLWSDQHSGPGPDASVRWWHLPLVYGPDGRRLAKRQDATSLESLRNAGVSQERVLGLLAWWSGFTDRPVPCSLSTFRQYVTPDTLRQLTQRERAPGGQRIASEECLAWLR
ncbi:MAG: glutamate--tRNA ligase family protein, partial [Phycisphaerae bacterium]|nr:glutamate--tRNA ligase family protein [Phycisphaerae bacterium]